MEIGFKHFILQGEKRKLISYYGKTNETTNMLNNMLQHIKQLSTWQNKYISLQCILAY